MSAAATAWREVSHDSRNMAGGRVLCAVSVSCFQTTADPMNRTSTITSFCRFVIDMPTALEFIVFSSALRTVEGIGSAAYFTASFTVVSHLFPSNLGLVMVCLHKHKHMPWVLLLLFMILSFGFHSVRAWWRWAQALGLLSDPQWAASCTQWVDMVLIWECVFCSRPRHTQYYECSGTEIHNITHTLSSCVDLLNGVFSKCAIKGLVEPFDLMTKWLTSYLTSNVGMSLI